MVVAWIKEVIGKEEGKRSLENLMRKMSGYERPLISIIVPVYNIQDYVEECLDSICRQTYNDIEIIVVDDGSTDGSNEICREFDKRDSRIRLIEKQNGGLVSARKVGVENSSGKYIAFVDGDDWIDDDFVEQVIPYISGRDWVDVVAFGGIEEYSRYQRIILNAAESGIYCNDSVKILQHQVIMTDKFFGWRVLPHLCNKIIKREILEHNIANVANEISYGEGAACVYPCLLEADSIAVLDIAPYHYRQREGSITKDLKEATAESMIKLHRVLKKAFENEELLQEQLKYFMFFDLMLKAYSKISDNMTLFPFEKVQAESRVLVYGAGAFGKVIERFVRKSDKLELSGWADKNAVDYQKDGLNVIAPDKILTKQFDYLVIAILDEDIARKVCSDLIEMGIDLGKIDFVQKEVLSKQHLPAWLEK